MQELTFETILRLPQMELKKRLKAELKSRGYPVTDKPGYLYAEGTIPVLLVEPTWTRFTVSLSSRYAIRQTGQ